MSLVGLIIGAAVGGSIGYGLAYFNAPQTGPESQKQLKVKALESSVRGLDRVGSVLDEVQLKVNQCLPIKRHTRVEDDHEEIVAMNITKDQQIASSHENEL